jgi:hypothetical protein
MGEDQEQSVGKKAEGKLTIKSLWKEWLTIVLSVGAVLNFFLTPLITWIPSTMKDQIRFGSFILLLTIAALVAHRCFLLKRVTFTLRRANPWLAFLLLILSIIIFNTVRLLQYRSEAATSEIKKLLEPKPPSATPKKQVMFSLARSGVFNSWEDQLSGHTKHIKASGALQEPWYWDIADSGRQGSFSYIIDPEHVESQNATSGGFLAFYDMPGDRRLYQKIVFFCQYAGSCGKADFGIRLTVDDPRSGTENFRYELRSLVQAKGRIEHKWNRFEIYISEFERRKGTQVNLPLPPNLDENTINKIVFFIDNDIGRQCPKNTIRIRDISLEP